MSFPRHLFEPLLEAADQENRLLSEIVAHGVAMYLTAKKNLNEGDDDG